MEFNNKKMISAIINIAINAGKAILGVYNSDDFEVEIKTDDSPLTKADKLSHQIIKTGLLSFYPEIPLLSEEGKDVLYEERKKWERYWLVDPLDGTKEFIKKNGEFTVNIALIENNEPTMGIIYAPAYHNNSINNSGSFPGVLYYGKKEIGSFKQVAGGEVIKLPSSNNTGNIKAVRSRSHASSEEEEIFKKYDVKETISVGSSLKFCIVAEDLAQIYYRHGPTNEWDVAAGYAIAKYAGAVISGLSFNKKNLLNSSFLVKNIT
jgi:3'(2'), 5'-bisphosphate nucleotidase